MRQLQKYMILAYLALCPIIYNVTSLDTRKFQELFWQYSVMAIIVTFSRNTIITAFFFLAIFLEAFNNFSVGQHHIFNLFLGICLFTCARSYFKSFKFQDYYKPMLFVAIASMIFMVLQHFNIDPIHSARNNGKFDYSSAFGDKIGLFGIKTHNGIYQALIVPVMLAILGPWGLLALPVVILSHSMAAVTSAVAGALLYMYHSSKRIFWILLTATILFGSIYAVHDYKENKAMFTSRFTLWHAVGKMGLGRYWGYGPASFDKFTPTKNFMFFGDQNYRIGIGALTGENGVIQGRQTDIVKIKEYHPNFFKMHKESPNFLKDANRWGDPHNLFVRIFFEYGFPGLILTYLFFHELYVRFSSSMKTQELVLISSMILAFFVASMTQFPLFVARLGYIFPLLLGAFYAVTDERNNRVS